MELPISINEYWRAREKTLILAVIYRKMEERNWPAENFNYRKINQERRDRQGAKVP